MVKFVSQLRNELRSEGIYTETLNSKWYDNYQEVKLRVTLIKAYGCSENVYDNKVDICLRLSDNFTRYRQCEVHAVNLDSIVISMVASIATDAAKRVLAAYTSHHQDNKEE